jgi:ribosome-binding ATPase YchF (GTP1/OBG family)
LDSADKKLFLNEMRISQPATEKIIHKSYELLGLISFFTYVENECRAWTIPAGSSVQKAAGAIHTDMERGFIKAEVVSFSDFIKCGSIAKCRENGVLKLEGKDYVVQDGDIVTIRFSP